MSMPAVKISVIIPVYNAEDNLGQCLNSVLFQTIKDLEIICVDDGSTDKSLAVLEAFQKNDPRIIVLHQENAGAGVARNLALSRAAGEFVAFMDADDWYPTSHVLDLLYTKAVVNGALVCGGSFSEYKDGKVNANYEGRYSAYTFNHEGFIDFKDFQFDYGYIRFIYNRGFLNANHLRFPPYRRFQDPPFFVNTMIHAERFYSVPEIVYCYRKGAKRVEWSDEKALDAVRGITDLLSISKEYGLAKLHVTALERINIEYYNIIMKKIRPDNLELLEQLIRTTNYVEPNLLIEEGYNIDRNKKYLIKPLRDSVTFYNSHEFFRLQQVQKRSGRVLTYLPRKIRGGVRCLRDNGIQYTIKRVIEKVKKCFA